MDRPSGKPTPFLVVDPGMAQRVLSAAHGLDPWDAVAALGLGAGMRREEMLALAWGAVDLEAARLRVFRTVDALRRRAAQVERRLAFGPAWRSGWRPE